MAPAYTRIMIADSHSIPSDRRIKELLIKEKVSQNKL
jgi:hypothetical protein